MITLDVADYCQNCPDFKPYCSVLKSADNVYTIVQCKKKDVCACIKEYIEAEMSKGE